MGSLHAEYDDDKEDEVVGKVSVLILEIVTDSVYNACGRGTDVVVWQSPE